ncbi:MAG: hypothetical protein ACRELF_11285, partial [Gemmataceae bacterium]
GKWEVNRYDRSLPSPRRDFFVCILRAFVVKYTKLVFRISELRRGDVRSAVARKFRWAWFETDAECSVPVVSLSPRPRVKNGQAESLAVFARHPGTNMGNIRNRPVGDPASKLCRTGPFGVVPLGVPPSATLASLNDQPNSNRRPCVEPVR